MTNMLLLRKASLDILALVAVGFVVLALPKFLTPPKVGFHCGDYSIHYPYQDSTVPTLLIGAICLFTPMLLMVLVEIVRFRFGRRSYLPIGVRIGKVNLHPVLLELIHLVGVFLFGAGCSQLATDIGKYSIGRLRPHFIAVCQPDLATLCPASVPPTKYITDFHCDSGTDEYRLKDARLSFPSGHASFSAYTMFYLAIYLQARLTWRGSHLIRPVLQALALALFWFTALSRVSDYKHHWSDVLAGAVIGLSVAALTAKYISHLFVNSRVPDEKTCETKMEHLNGHKSISSSECSPMKSVIVENMA